jgi:hypothetical protein
MKIKKAVSDDMLGYDSRFIKPVCESPGPGLINQAPTLDFHSSPGEARGIMNDCPRISTGWFCYLILYQFSFTFIVLCKYI